MTKKFLSFMFICVIIFLANYSRMEQSNDPIIGIWSLSKTVSKENSSKAGIRKEWIFNDLFFGRYHEISGTTTTLKTDFKWSRQDNLYTIAYRDTEGKPIQVFTIKKMEDGTYLKNKEGGMLALRE